MSFLIPKTRIRLDGALRRCAIDRIVQEQDMSSTKMIKLMKMCMVADQAATSGKYRHRGADNGCACCLCLNHTEGRSLCENDQCECKNHFKTMACLLYPDECPRLKYENFSVCCVTGVVMNSDYHICTMHCDKLVSYAHKGHCLVCSVSGQFYEGTEFSVPEYMWRHNNDVDEYQESSVDMSHDNLESETTTTEESAPVDLETTDIKFDNGASSGKKRRGKRKKPSNTLEIDTDEKNQSVGCISVVSSASVFRTDPTQWKELNSMYISGIELIRNALVMAATKVVRACIVGLSSTPKAEDKQSCILQTILISTCVYYYAWCRNAMNLENSNSIRRPSAILQVPNSDSLSVFQDSPSSMHTQPSPSKTVARSESISSGFSKTTPASKNKERMSITPFMCCIIQNAVQCDGLIYPELSTRYKSLLDSCSLRPLKDVATSLQTRVRLITNSQSIIQLALSTCMISEWVPETWSQPPELPKSASEWKDLLN